jgi:hypothetical protein
MYNRQILQLIQDRLAVSFAEGGPKGCKKGKSCGATCIYAQDECVLELDPKVSKSLSQVVEYVKRYVQKGGSEEVAQKALERFESSGTVEGNAKKIGAALDGMASKYPDPAEREKKIEEVFDLVLPGIAKKGDTGEKQAYDEEQINSLMKNKSIDAYEKIYRDVESGKLKTPEEINDALRPLAQGRRVNEISDEQVDLAMSMLPKDLVSGLSKQGQPGEWGKWGANQSTLDVPEGGHTPTNKSGAERARLIVRIGLEEGMRDMYTGQKVGFGDIDLEHTIPFGVAKAGAETGSNFGLTTRLNNRAKGDISPEDWRAKVLKQYEVKDGKLTRAAQEKLQREQMEATRYNDSKAAVTGGTRPDTVATVFKGIDDSAEKPAIKQKLKNKAMQSMAGYGETYLQGFRENRPGASRRVYIYRDSIPGTKVLDTAAAKIDKYAQEGNTEKVEKILETLRTGAPRINKALDDQYGPKRLDSQATEAADVANKVREDILKEIEAI